MAAAILGDARTVDAIVATTDLPVATVLATLTLLERARRSSSDATAAITPDGDLLGRARCRPPDDRSRRRPRAVARLPGLVGRCYAPHRCAPQRDGSCSRRPPSGRIRPLQR